MTSLKNKIEIQCPNCEVVYTINESELQNGMVECGEPNCSASYLQKFHSTNNFYFVRKALHTVKGEG